MITTTASASERAQSLPLDLNLSEGAQALYDALRGAAEAVADYRGYCAAVSQVHFFAPGEIVADALCIARSTLYRKIAELKAADLIDARAHYVTHEGRTRADGMVWAVKMHPERNGRVRVPYDALKASYRCLSADIASGRTAFRQIGQSKELQEKQVDIEKILGWAIPPSTTQTPGILLTVRSDLEQVLDVLYVERDDRNIAVDGAARAMTAALRDGDGLMFYRRLLWQLLRRYDATGEDCSYQVYLAAQRARTDAQEGFARRPGALFVSRLKAAPFFEPVMRGPPIRVGTKPLQS